MFADVAGKWTAAGSTLGGRLRRASTEVLRVEPTGAQMTSLVLATVAGRRSLVALWSTSHGRWTQSAPLALANGAAVVSTAVGAPGTVAALEERRGGVTEAYAVTPGGAWSRLPAPPPRTVALSVGSQPSNGGGAGFDAFTVSGTRFDVYATSPAGSPWVQVQSSRVPLAYGSSA
jgi:hypothetical protein